MNVLKRAALTAALLAAPFAATQPADAAVIGCAGSHLDYRNIQIPAYVDCTLNATANCLFVYDPVAHPVPNFVAPETVKFVLCVAA